MIREIPTNPVFQNAALLAVTEDLIYSIICNIYR